ncbi:hypothetical protein PMAYCL1PPCAC_08683, partial [Pristionchus mayeri]
MKCMKTLQNRADINERMRFNCKLCPKKYATKQGLKEHERSHLEEEKKPFKCMYCDRRFVMTGDRKAHENIHLEDGDPSKKIYRCEICSKTFPYRMSLMKHSQS